jgi:hypothetical protein
MAAAVMKRWKRVSVTFPFAGFLGTPSERLWDTFETGRTQTPLDCHRGQTETGGSPPTGRERMDPGPIINLFNQWITLGAAIALVVCAFFVMLAGYQ